MFKKILGKHAEDIAVSFLKKRGFLIIERNFFTRLGEIDIVAKEGDFMVFVEVRSARGSSFHDPLESITASKIKRLQKLALLWLNYRGLAESFIRFDVIAVIFKERYNNTAWDRFFSTGPNAEIRHIKNAF